MNIFVARLSQSITSDALVSLFATYGAVAHAKVIMDKETGKSKSFGFVEMPDIVEAMEAISALNNKEIEGRKIEVKHSKAKPKDEPALILKKVKRRRPDDEY
jgi:RNA recognition motif-containing protein